MNGIKIGKTEYAVTTQSEDADYMTYELLQGRTAKTLIGRKSPAQIEWVLWSGRVGLPKQVEPIFLDDIARQIESLKAQANAAFDAGNYRRDLDLRYEILRLENL